MTPDELIEQTIRAANAQVDLNKKILDNHLAAASIIASRHASEAITEVAKQIALNPTP